MPARLFVNPSGQRDNLGDSVLRRAYLDALRRHGELHVHVGDNDEYASALGLIGADVVYRSKKAWFQSAWRGNKEAPMTFALNAGEIVLDRQFLLKAVWHRALLHRSQRQGGKSIAWGIAVRPEPTTARWALSNLLKHVGHVSWRDAASRNLFKKGDIAPDWAFSLGQSDGELTQNSAPRTIIAVSLRGDRPAPSDRWIETVRRLADENDAEIVAVVQVHRDAARAQELASRLKGRVLNWTTENHAEQEVRVRHLYSETLAVVSDRIHALIIGMTEGAVPIGYTPGSIEKVERTFAALTPIQIAFSDKTMDSVDESLATVRRILDQKQSMFGALRRGRARLAAMHQLVDLRLN
jgi:polysaccharide pyruvyl transferase WcaK-like protein